MSDSEETGIVASGHQRVREALAQEIRPLVEAKYARGLAEAGLLRRWLLRRRIAREIRREVERRCGRYSLHLR